DDRFFIGGPSETNVVLEVNGGGLTDLFVDVWFTDESEYGEGVVGTVAGL
ncbi:hypothetical protein A2U01_0087686, partial [Trifolium medium]|nr:hypothetical protein [Trifolium medium]